MDPAKVEAGLIEKKLDKEDIDLIIGDLPGFSNIGKSKIISLIREGNWDGEETRRNSSKILGTSILTICTLCGNIFNPEGFVMENVTGMLTSVSKEFQYEISLRRIC